MMIKTFQQYYLIKKKVEEHMIKEKKPSLTILQIQELVNEFEEFKYLREAILKQQSNKFQEPLYIRALNEKWGQITNKHYLNILNNNNSYIFSWKTLYGFIQALKQQRILKIKIKINSLEIRNKYEALLQCDNMGTNLGKNNQEMIGRFYKKYQECKNKKRKLKYLCKKGLLESIRRQVYKQVFNEIESFKIIKTHTQQILEKMVEKDVQEFIEQDQQYFVFKQMCIEVCNNIINRNQNFGINRFFKGFTLLVAPFCYLDKQVTSIQKIFCCYFSRYLINLQTISCKESTIINLLLTFEGMMRNYLRKLNLHLMEIGVELGEIVMKWIFFCFLNKVDVQQFFQIADRIIGFDGLDILILISVSIIMLKEDELLATEDPNEAKIILQNFNNINIIECTRHFLCRL